MKINLKWILYLPIIFFFLPAFYFWLPGINKQFCVYNIVTIFVLILLIFADRYSFFKHIKSTIENTPIKYLLIFFLLISFSSLFVSLFLNVSILRVISRILKYGVLIIIPSTIFFSCVINKYIAFNKIFRLFILLYWICMLLGILAYIGQYFDIKVINDLFDFLANSRIIAFTIGNKATAQNVYSNYTAFGLPRLDNLCEEPSYYARFITFFLPLLYAVSSSKLKILKNKFINCFLLWSIIPLTWLNLILTLSPIFLLMCIVITIIYYIKNIIKFLKEHITIVFCVCVVILITACLLRTAINVSETYLSRIFNIIINVRTFDDLIIIEPSLATRLIIFINLIILYFRYPILGCGYENSAYFILPQIFINSPVNLNAEIIDKVGSSLIASKPLAYNTGYIYVSFAENGLLTLLLIYFIIKIFQQINKYKNYFYIYGNKLNYSIASALKGMLISTMILLFYDCTFYQQEVYFIFAISCAAIYHWKTSNSILKEKNYGM